jgi:PAS domain S-box-containing protein
VCRDITDEQRSEEQLRRQTAFVHVAEVVAVAANTASTVEAALQVAVDEVGRMTGWPVGHVYVVAPDAPDLLRPTMIWHEEANLQNAAFRAATEATSMRRGVGLPGRVLEHNRPVWLLDVTRDPSDPRAAAAAQSGLRAAFGFPVRVGTDVVAVLEFFSGAALPPDEALLEVMASIGAQLGHALERQHEAEALHGLEGRFRALAESAPDAIVTADAEGRIVYWNPRAQAVFGYDDREVIGLPLTALIPERYRNHYSEGIARLRRAGERRRTARIEELSALRQNGSEFPVEFSLATWNAGADVFFTAVMRDVTRRKQVEQDLRELSTRLMRLQDEERRRIARDLHENNGPLSALISKLYTAKKRAQEVDVSTLELLDDAIALAENMTHVLRTVSHRLHPPLLDEQGLVSSLRWYATGYAARAGIRLDMDLPVVARRWPEAVEIVLFRIVQESLSNIVRHSQSRVARIRLTQEYASVTLEVSDEGRGLPDAVLKTLKSGRAEAGIGIPGMRERVRQLGGRLDINSTGAGTTIKVVLPISPT